VAAIPPVKVLRILWVAMQKRGKTGEMLLFVWQVIAACAAVGIVAGLLCALLSMPKTGYDCNICVKVSCQNFLGWECARSVNREGHCQLLVFPDTTGQLVCPSDQQVELGPVQLPLVGSLDGICASHCYADAPRLIAPPNATVLSPPPRRSSTA
jgi:hypothetical protein